MSRPRIRGDCVNGPRPCPYVSCVHHLAVTETIKGGLIRPGRGKNTIGIKASKIEDVRIFGEIVVSMLDVMPETCSLDVADKGAHTLDDVAVHMGVTRERCRQLQEDGLRKLRKELSKMIDENIKKKNNTGRVKK